MNYEKFTEYLSAQNIVLNKQQEKAMRTVKGPTLLLAVPGSGKTTTMIARIGYMIHCNGIKPDKILTLTYTTDATKDMRKRYIEIFGDNINNAVQFQTINSFCLAVMTEYAKRYNDQLPELEKDNSFIIRSLYQREYNEYPLEGDINESRRIISYIKNMQLSDEEIRKLKIGENNASSLYYAYVNEMNKLGKMDFDDQLIYALNILCTCQDITKMYQLRYPYLLVDEAQDTSKIQHEVIAVLASRSQNIFMVGDEDQSIYGFRAAYPKALLDFENKYDAANILFLEQNYRSTPQIVKAADSFIKQNVNRKQKNMFTEKTDGDNIQFISCDSRLKQYSKLVEILRNTNEKTAVLYRANESAIPLVYYLKGAGIPFNKKGVDVAFFTHKVVNDFRLFVLFAQNPQNGELFKQIYFKTKAKIKKVDAYRCIEKFDYTIDKSLFHTYKRLFCNSNSKKLFIQSIIDGFDNLRNDSAWDAIKRIRFELRDTKDSEYEKFNILGFLTKYGEGQENFLKKLDWLRKEISTNTYSEENLITISTVHSSKGLEYDQVYIIDAIDGVMPSTDNIDYEEERRIFYVAMTRAKNKLTLVRYKDAKMPFVDSVIGKKTVTRKTSKAPQKSKAPKSTKKIAEQAKPASAFFKIGDKLIHETKGNCVVVELKKEVVVVKFDSGEIKKYGADVCVKKGILRRM